MADVTPQLSLADLRALAEGGAADLTEAILSFVAQPDPQTGPVPTGALTAAALNQKLSEAYNNPAVAERRVQIALVWQKYLTQTNPLPAPRFLLADFLLWIYERGDEPSRSTLIELFGKAPLKMGLWGGMKRVFKRAEALHDPQIFGALAARFDVEAAGSPSGDVTKATLVYLKRRAWRYLRQLGKAVPELYPQFAAATLVQLPAAFDLSRSWVAAHILFHESKDFDGTHYTVYGKLPADLVKDRAYDATWKRAADPLMLLLEAAQNDTVARYAISALRRDFPDVLRKVDAPWLDRVSRRPLPSVHEFVVETLQGSVEFQSARLKSLGLHETVLALLNSPSPKARTYAIEYARAHAQDLPADRLVELAASPHADTSAWAASALQKLGPKQIGHLLLGRLLNTNLTGWAEKNLNEGFDRKELPRPWLIDMLFGSNGQAKWALTHLTTKYAAGELGAEFWKSVLADPRAKEKSNIAASVFTELLKLPAEAVGGAWALEALQVRVWRHLIDPWLQKVEALPGADVEKIKGLVFDPQLRTTALKLLGRPKIARLADLTLPWLLALARRADPTLNGWATRYLLENVSPADAGGPDRLFELATGAKEPEPVRQFAQTYLTCHHPQIGPTQPQSIAFGLKPQLTLEAYKPEPYWKATQDLRPDVRRFALQIIKASLRRWGWHTRVYELADSEFKEVRNVAFDALLKAGQPGADPQATLTVEELDPARIFAMTESRIRSSRELAMELITRHYGKLGGADRLGWLMASSDRTVRQMAVRILWERHRPRALPDGWKPSTGTLVEQGDRFTDVEALRSFLKTLLFGLPPGRSPEPAEGGHGIRKVSAGVAKQRAVEAARDLALVDESFARVLSPVLLEFTGSVARGEWQTCLAALVSLQLAHPKLELGLKKGA